MNGITVIDIPVQELVSAGARMSGADRMAINDYLNQSEVVIRRGDPRIDEAVETLLDGWSYSLKDLDLPEDATEQQIDVALRPLIRDFLWVMIVHKSNSLMESLDWNAGSFTSIEEHNIQAVRELRAKRGDTDV